MRYQGGGPDFGLVIEHPDRGVLTDIWPWGTVAFGPRYRTTWDLDRRKALVFTPEAVRTSLTLMPYHMSAGCQVLRYRRRSWFRQPIVEEMVA